MAACMRSRRPRRLSMLEMWFLTVPSLITSCSAIARFVAPFWIILARHKGHFLHKLTLHSRMGAAFLLLIEKIVKHSHQDP
jgi:hypothetical protein